MKRLMLDKKDLIIGGVLILAMALAVGFGLRIEEAPKALIISQEEFVNYSKADIMISNISYFRAEEIAEDIRQIEGVYSLKFDNSPNHYRETSVLFMVSFYGEDSDELSILALNRIKNMLKPYDTSIYSTVGQDNDILADGNRIEALFGYTRSFELIIPSGDYDSEIELITSLSRYREVDRIFGLSNTSIRDKFFLTEGVCPSVFADLTDLDHEVSQKLYSTYAVKIGEEERIISGISNYKVPYINMLDFLYEEVQEGYIRLDREHIKKIEAYNYEYRRLKAYLEGNNYSRIFIRIDEDLSEDGREYFTRRIFKEASSYYNLDSVFLVGEDGVSYEKN